MKKFLFILLMIGFTTTAESQPLLSLKNFITEWLGVPYKYAGSTKKGIDCSKFTQRLFKDVYNTVIPGTCRTQYAAAAHIPKDSLQLGDVLFFTSRRSPSGWHCGFYLGDGYFIHAPSRGDSVKISSLQETHYSTNFKAAGRFKVEEYTEIELDLVSLKNR